MNSQFCTKLQQSDVNSRIQFVSNIDGHIKADKKCTHIHAQILKRKKLVNGNSSLQKFPSQG